MAAGELAKAAIGGHRVVDARRSACEWGQRSQNHPCNADDHDQQEDDDNTDRAYMQKTRVSGDNISANFLDVIGFSAKFRDFIRIFEKTVSAISLAFCMYATVKDFLGEEGKPANLFGLLAPVLLSAHLRFHLCFYSFSHF